MVLGLLSGRLVARPSKGFVSLSKKNRGLKSWPLFEELVLELLSGFIITIVNGLEFNKRAIYY